MTGPTPERFFNAVNAYQQTAALKAAVELGFFTAIAQAGEGTAGKGATAAQVASFCKVNPRGARILADFLAIMGFLRKTGDGENARYVNADDSALFLDRNSPAYCGSAVEFLASIDLRHHFDNIADRVRNGGAPLSGDNSLAPNHEMWIRFARGMAGLATGPARMLAQHTLGHLNASPGKPLKVLDIAAGHGMYGIAFAQQHKNAHIVAQDWPVVLPVALEHASKLGVADRYSTLPGNAFDIHFGGGYDIILIPNFLHHFDSPTNVGLLKKCFAALHPGGLCQTLEFAPDNSRLQPRSAGAFALVMLATTPAGDAFTVDELTAMYREAGFTDIHATLPPGSIQCIISGKKAA